MQANLHQPEEVEELNVAFGEELVAVAFRLELEEGIADCGPLMRFKERGCVDDWTILVTCMKERNDISSRGEVFRAA